MKTWKIVGFIFVLFGLFYFGVRVGGISALDSIHALVPPAYVSQDQDHDPLWTIRTETGYHMHNHFLDYRAMAAGLIFIGVVCWLVAYHFGEKKRNSSRNLHP